MSELAYNIVWSEAFSLYFNTHDTQPSYRIIQVNEFVCLVGNKNLFDGWSPRFTTRHKILRNCFDVVAYYFLEVRVTQHIA